MALKLYESDSPRSFNSKLAEYTAKPAWPSIRFLKDQISVITQPSGKRIEFAVRSGLPIPLVYTIYVEAMRGDKSEKIHTYDHIGPISTDDWVLEIEEWEPEKVEMKVGIEPWEIGTDTVEVML